MIERTFKVFDNNTGKEADPSDIALHEEWAKNLVYCDMEGFALLEDGTLILLDECGNFAYCLPERFEVRWDENTVPSNIIRCKDCKFYTKMRTDTKYGICSLASRHLGDDGYCSEAEERRK